MFARKGEVETDIAHKAVNFHIFDARFEQRDSADPADFEKVHQGITMKESVFSISLQELYEKNKNRNGTSSKTLTELIHMEKDLKRNRTDPALLTTMMRTVVRTEVNKRFSVSLAALALCLIAVPLAVTANRKETSIGFFFSIIIGFCYFFFIEFATTVQNNPKWHPELLIWLPNVLFISLGGFMFWKLSRK
jgi:lipopolysaccharide export system permease protein